MIITILYGQYIFLLSLLCLLDLSLYWKNIYVSGDTQSSKPKLYPTPLPFISSTFNTFKDPFTDQPGFGEHGFGFTGHATGGQKTGPQTAKKHHNLQTATDLGSVDPTVGYGQNPGPGMEICDL